VEADYFRIEKDKYFIPITAKIPGSALAFHKKGSRQATELDFIAEVRDQRNRPAATVRDTIPLKVNTDVAGQVVQKSIQYDTGVTLTPGKYNLRFVARENGEGKVGTFESNLTIPDLSRETSLRVSSVVLSNQREPSSNAVAAVKNSRKLVEKNPLIADGQKLVPNVTRVFQPGQSLFVYVEVYDPEIPSWLPENFRRTNIAASVALYADGKKILETPPVRAIGSNEQRFNTTRVWLQLSTASLKPGRYVCQVNLIDEFGKKFAFPRTAMAVTPASKRG
jgi:uncharacterized protein (DUF2141 family)